MKIILTALLFLTAFCSYGQSVVPLRGDTIKIYKVGGNGELVIKNRTRDTAGIAYNAGGGLVEFGTPVRLNDSTIQIGPVIIITQGPGSTPGTPSGDTIYIAAAVDTIYLHNIGNLSPAQRVLFAVNGDLRASNWGDGLFTKVHFWADSSMSIDIDSGALRTYLNIVASGILSITGDNGLTATTATNLQLGGTLLHTTTINEGLYNLVLTGASTNGFGVLSVTNTADNPAIEAASTGSNATIIGNNGGAGPGVEGFSNSGPGGAFISTSGRGIDAQSTSGTAGVFTVVPTSTNTVVSVLNITRSSSGTAANGIGGSIDYLLGLSDSFSHTSNQLVSIWTDAALSTRTSEFSITGELNGVTNTLIRFRGNGVINTPLYPVFANNAAALAGGLVAGDHYRNGDADNIAH